MMFRRRAATTFVAVATTMAGAIVAGAQPTAPSDTEGQRVFWEQGCYGCHTLGRVGTPIGPDLSTVGMKYSRAALRRWLEDPRQVRPSAHMPKLELTQAQIESLAVFLAAQRSE